VATCDSRLGAGRWGLANYFTPYSSANTVVVLALTAKPLPATSQAAAPLPEEGIIAAILIFRTRVELSPTNRVLYVNLSVLVSHIQLNYSISVLLETTPTRAEEEGILAAILIFRTPMETTPTRANLKT